MFFKKNKMAAVALCGMFAAALATPFSAGISAPQKKMLPLMQNRLQKQTVFLTTCPLPVHPPISPRFK